MEVLFAPLVLFRRLRPLMWTADVGGAVRLPVLPQFCGPDVPNAPGSPHDLRSALATAVGPSHAACCCSTAIARSVMEPSASRSAKIVPGACPSRRSQVHSRSRCSARHLLAAATTRSSSFTRADARSRRAQSLAYSCTLAACGCCPAGSSGSCPHDSRTPSMILWGAYADKLGGRLSNACALLPADRLTTEWPRT